MSQNAVRCPWKKYVLLPENLSVFAGTDCICPSACPSYKSRQSCCMYARFTVRKDSAELPASASEAYSYTREEILKQFPDYVAPTAPAAVVEEPVVHNMRVEQPAQPVQFFPRVTETVEQSESKPKKYGLPIFGGGRAVQTDYEESAPYKKAFTLAPQRSYNWFELRGVYYTLDGRNGTGNLSDSICVNRLFNKILSSYDLSSVFEGNSLRDSFLWVLDNTLTGERRIRAVRVLQEELDSAKKFFLLFYGAIFFDKPVGSQKLYWANGYTENLQPVYDNATDFYSKIADGSDGHFYIHNPELALLWMRKIDLFDWQDRERLRDAICKIQDNVAIDPSSEIIVFWSTDKFVSLGLKSEFVNNLTVSDKTLVELEYTAEFLSRFDILRQCGQYRIVKRVPDVSYIIEVDDREINDDVTAMLFPRERSLNKLEYYLYILKRYCELFSPRAVKISDITFEDGCYSEQVEQLVFDMCAFVFGDASGEEQKIKANNCAMLAKLLYSKGVLFKSAKAARSGSFMRDLLAMVSNDGYPENRVQTYFGFCKKNGIADKIMLFSFDCTVVPPKAKKLPLRDWISKTIQGSNGTVDLCSRLQLPVFVAYKAVFGAGDAYKRETDEMYEYYKKQEKSIQEVAAKL